MVKWHDGIQLVSGNVWPAEEPPTPVAITRRLREFAKRKEMLPLEVLAELANTMSVGQLKRLKSEFPVMDAVAAYRPILALFARIPDYFRRAPVKPGIPLQRDVIQCLSEFLPDQQMRFLADRGARYLTV